MLPATEQQQQRQQQEHATSSKSKARPGPYWGLSFCRYSFLLRALLWQNRKSTSQPKQQTWGTEMSQGRTDKQQQQWQTWGTAMSLQQPTTNTTWMDGAASWLAHVWCVSMCWLANGFSCDGMFFVCALTSLLSHALVVS
jgi:hypothetical protein